MLFLILGVTASIASLGPSVDHLDFLETSAHHSIIRILIGAVMRKENQRFNSYQIFANAIDGTYKILLIGERVGFERGTSCGGCLPRAEGLFSSRRLPEFFRTSSGFLLLSLILFSDSLRLTGIILAISSSERLSSEGSESLQAESSPSSSPFVISISYLFVVSSFSISYMRRFLYYWVDFSSSRSIIGWF